MILSARPVRGDLDVVPNGGFKEDIGGLAGTTGGQAADNATDGFDAFIVGYHYLAGAEGIFLLIQAHEGFTPGGAVHTQVALHLVRIEHMQRAVAVIGEKNW